MTASIVSRDSPSQHCKASAHQTAWSIRTLPRSFPGHAARLHGAPKAIDHTIVSALSVSGQFAPLLDPGCAGGFHE